MNAKTTSELVAEIPWVGNANDIVGGALDEAQALILAETDIEEAWKAQVIVLERCWGDEANEEDRKWWESERAEGRSA